MRGLSIAMSIALLAWPTYAAAPAATPAPQTPAAQAPAGDALSALETPAKFAVVMDFETGTLLFSKNGDELMKPASMAKLVTVAILFEKLRSGEIKLNDTFVVSEGAWRQSISAKSAASKMFVHVGDAIRVEDLIRGIVVQSGNDACTVVAEHIAGTEEAFARLMNAQAKKMGLTKSHFTNSNGMPDPNQNVTARELAMVARYIIKEFPDYYRYFGEREFTWSNIKQYNRNLLIDAYPGADGLKTGHTAESGYGLTASATQGGRRLIVVINGLTSEAQRVAEARRLLDIGFHEFQTYALFKAGEPVGEAQVWAGDEGTVKLTVREPVKVLLRRASRDGMRVTLKYTEPVMPPIKSGQQLGSLVITAPGAPETVVPVYAGSAVEEGGVVGHFMLGMKSLLEGDKAQADRDVTVAPQAEGSAASDAAQ